MLKSESTFAQSSSRVSNLNMSVEEQMELYSKKHKRTMS